MTPQMTPELYQRLKPLYDGALELPVVERAAFVDEACKDDPQLKYGLQNLLAANDEETGTLDKPIFDHHAINLPGEQIFADGTVLLGRFRIVRLLGSGGMGEVYEAIDTQLGRIALKTVRGDITSSPERLLRFRKEVQLARSVSNPHVCRIHELFLTEGSDGAFVTMEFLAGVTLADKIRASGPLPWRDARKVALELCAALESIHEAEIIHRDLKARNIMLAVRNGTPCTVLMDFGIARRLSHQSGDTSTAITEDGTILGTPDYMAPEQFQGKEPAPATDVYALGVVFYELATGKRPVRDAPNRARSGETKTLARPSSLQSGIPRRFDEVVCKCLEYDPKRRYQTAKEVERAIRLPSIVLRIQQRPLTAAAGVLGVAIFLSSLLLVPAIGESARGIILSSSEKHIAVLPLDFVGGSSTTAGSTETQALGDGLMDSLSGKLANLDPSNHSLWVVPASEVRSRKVTSASSALREFGATIVVRGSFERRDQATRLNLTLIDPKNTREIGYVSVDSETGDLVALQEEAVTRLGRLMNISTKNQAASGNAHFLGRPAYEDYLAALGYIQRFDIPGNLDTAIALLTNATKTDPHFALGFADLGRAYILKYRNDKDEKWLTPAQVYCAQAARLDDKQAETYVALGDIHEITSEPQLAIQEFKEAIDLDPRDPAAFSGLGQSYQDSGLNPQAEKAYLQAIALRPSDWNGYNNLGTFYDQTGRQKEAIEQLNRALQLSPDNSAIYANLGSAFLNSGDPISLTKAEQALNKSVALHPSYQAYANLGNLFGIERRFAESAAFSEKAIGINDHDYMVWNNLTQAYEALGKSELASHSRGRAIELLEAAVNLNSHNTEALAMLAALLAKNGLRVRSLQNIQSALALAPKDYYVLSEAADTYELLGKRKLAIRYLEEALRNGLPVEQIKGDVNLERIRADPSFQMPASHGLST